MKKIRTNTFETNSSSTHSLTIGSGPRKNISLDDDNNLHVELGEFGWEWRDYDDYPTLLSYVFTALDYGSEWENTELLNNLIELIKHHYNVNEIIIDNPNDYNYVDHGSEHIQGMDANDLFNFIFNRGSELSTGNDNE